MVVEFIVLKIWFTYIVYHVYRNVKGVELMYLTNDQGNKLAYMIEYRYN